jgi:DNA-binding transcriptional ArsR family regulator
MSEEQVTKSKKAKLSSRILRERLGAVPQKPLGISREHSKFKKKINTALKEGPKTVPELAQATGLPSKEVLWHLMSLKKYGKVTEGEEQGNYVEYALKSREEEER